MQRITETIKVASHIKNIRKISSRIVDLLMERNIDKPRIFDIRLSVEEAVLNAIEHGNKKKSSLNVTVSFAIDNDKAEISVEDEGKGFDYHSLPDPTTDDNILRSHGRGVYLIHKLMDEVQYNDKGNRVKMTKYLK